MMTRSKTAELLIQRGADVNVQHKTLGYAPLHLASARGYLDIVKLLILKKIDVNERDTTDNGTALIASSIRGNVEVTRFLLQNGADVNAVCMLDKTTNGTALDCVEFFLKNDQIKIWGTSVKHDVDRKKLLQVKKLLRAYGAKFLSELK